MKLLNSVLQARELAAHLRLCSEEICKDNGCTNDDHKCDSYAYVRCDLQLLDICAPDFFRGCSVPHAAIALPFIGTDEDLIEVVSEQCDWE